MSNANFEEKLQEIENEVEGKVDKAAEVINDASPDQVAAMLEMADEESEGKGSLDSREEKADEKIEAKKEEVEPEKTSEKEPEKKEDKVEDKVEDKTPTTSPLQITDEFIAKADEKDRNILQAIKGETFSPKALQNYINAQRKIGELGQKIGQVKEEPVKKAIPDEIPQQKLTEEVQKLKDVEVVNRLRQTFKDLPDDPEELREYLSTLQASDPDRYWDYRELKRDIQTKVDTDFNRAIYIQENQSEINQTILNNEIESIQNELKEYGIDDPKKYGFDFTVTRDESGKFKNPLLQELITTDGKNLDPTVITYIGNVPIFNEKALFNKFFLAKGKVIRDVLKAQVSTGAKKEAFEELSKKQKVADNTASITKGGEPTKSTPKTLKSPEDIEKLGPKEVEELLARESN